MANRYLPEDPSSWGPSENDIEAFPYRNRGSKPPALTQWQAFAAPWQRRAEERGFADPFAMIGRDIAAAERDQQMREDPSADAGGDRARGAMLDAAALGIGRAEVEPSDAGEGYRLGAYRAGLEGDAETAADQARRRGSGRQALTAPSNCFDRKRSCKQPPSGGTATTDAPLSAQRRPMKSPRRVTNTGAASRKVPRMAFNPFEEKGIPLDDQLRNWSELNVAPYRKEEVHPYSRTRGILMNGIEVEAVMFSHQMARNTLDPEVKRKLAMLRRIEAQQQKAINWLIPADESTIEVTLGYEQVAVDLTAWLAQNEADPYLKQVYDFALLEDFDHLYRYANLYQLIEGKKAEAICGGLTEITPGRPTVFEHRHPHDEIRRPMTALAADPQSVLNALTIVAAEQQTMNFYMNIGNRYQEPLARATYAEIAQIEEQHVTHYESILDPAASWFQNLVLHQWHECWMYWSCMEDEPDPRVRAIYELHCAMEVEHLRVACELMREVEKRDPEAIVPAAAFERPLVFQSNKQYVREILASQTDMTAKFADFVPVSTLAPDDRYFAYQRKVNDDWSPTEEVIRRNAEENGEEYRLETEGPHPVPGLRMPEQRGEDATDYARAESQPERPRATAGGAQ